MLSWPFSKKKESCHSAVAKVSLVDSLPGDTPFSRRSYSQCGEDMIVAFLAHTMRIENIYYLDIGAYSHAQFSNTFFFYERGFFGTCVEANPSLADAFIKERPNDEVLNIAVSPSLNGIAPFYVLSAPTLSTLSKDEADRLVHEEDVSLLETINIDVWPINKLLSYNQSETKYNYLTIDVEGIDFEIIKEADFSIYRPDIICLETLEYKKQGAQKKNEKLISLMIEKDYIVHADTQINTIFVDRNKWDNRAFKR